MNVQSMAWVEYSDKREEINVAVIPVGAVEAYGPHLPMGTDGLAVEHVAGLVAQRTPVFVAPLVSVGCSGTFEAFPGTLSVSPSALAEYLGGIARSFIRHGVEKILFLNGHAGNVCPIALLMDPLQRQHNVSCAQVDFWRFTKPLTTHIVEDPDGAFGHASEAMTSIMLFLMPEKVHLERLTPPFPAPRSAVPGLMTPHAAKPPESLALSGDPTPATAEKGRQIVEAAVNALVEMINTW
jgi:creatinine amidohydrolase